MQDDVELEVAQGLICHQTGDRDAAAAHYRNALSLRPGDAEASHLLGLLLAQGGDMAEGQRLLRQAIAAAPEVPLYRFNLATVQLEIGEHEQAIVNFEACRELAPSFPGLALGLGRAHGSLGRYGLAVECLEEAVATAAPDDLTPLLVLAKLHLEHCFYPRAVAVLEKLRQAMGDDPTVMALLVDACDGCGDQLRALALCRELGALRPEDAMDMYRVIAARRMASRDYELAIAVYESALSLQPDDQSTLAALDEVREIQRKIAASVGKIPLENIDLLFIEVSKKCNYKCTFCGHPHMPASEKRQMRLDDVKSLTSIIERVKAVDITGYGEITAHPDFDALLDFFATCAVPVRFVTNGSLLTEARVATIAASTVEEIVVSLNALDEAHYRYLSFGEAGAHKERFTSRNVVAGIDRLLAVRRESGRPLRVYVTFVITSVNFREMHDFVDFAAERGVPITFQGLVPKMNDIYPPGLHVPDTPENRQHLDSVVAYAKSRGVRLCPFNFDTQRIDDAVMEESALVQMVRTCDWVYTKSFIAMNGDVGPCCWSDGHFLGNIFRQNFEDIWNGEPYEDLRTRIREGDVRYCRHCRRLG